MSVCTVSIVPTAEGFRLVCNRDERRSRPPALPPRVWRAGDLEATCPIDPASGGSWIGVNDAGLVFALLNRSEGRHPLARSQAPLSRGGIVPSLLMYDRLVPAIAAALALAPARFEPFRLVAAERSTAAVVTSDGRRVTHAFLNVVEPLLWTSSSLGDALVERPRSALFDRLVRDLPAAAWPRGQRRFHRHRWPRHPELSVVMSRAGACTVSRTEIEVGASGATATNGVRRVGISLRYEPLPCSGPSIEQLKGAA